MDDQDRTEGQHWQKIGSERESRIRTYLDDPFSSRPVLKIAKGLDLPRRSATYQLPTPPHCLP
jgi:hypothetical protein